MIKKVTVADYGLGNLFSISRALSHIGAEPVITDDPEKIAQAGRLILPGVGAFGEGMHNLSSKNLIEPVRMMAASGRPMLGICLGMQLMMSEGEELGHHEGLDLIQGAVVRFPSPSTEGPHYKIPHVGWNSIYRPGHIETWQGTILEGITDGDSVYFVHSYLVVPDDESHTLAETTYGGLTYCSVIRNENIMGCQFHPEKSGETGLKILNNFISI